MTATLFETGRAVDAPYRSIYEGLCDLREEFHRSGRLDDSNAKLDEVVKLFATYLAVRLGGIEGFPAPPQRPDGQFVAALQACFAKAARLPYYLRNDGVSTFGPAPTLALRESDAALATRLSHLVVHAVDEAFTHQKAGNPYDVLNEAFGHFVRDNFRGNIEDAQYLTPAQVVDLMTSIALDDLRRSGRLAKKDDLIIVDPCCGVGSFLAAFATRYRAEAGPNAPSLALFGQDKVERMVRLTMVNLTLFRVFEHSVTLGNSLYRGSPLDDLNGRADVIVTNPPFGARFPIDEVAFKCASNTPFFSGLGRARAPIDSELLFVDRALALLRDGGVLLIVVPDGVVSAVGTAALLRHHLRQVATLRGVIELPSVTFAQAGTRTKTAILYLQKGTAEVRKHRVFLGVSEDLGFQVSSRKGIHIKVERGDNDLPRLLSAYSRMHQRKTREEVEILSEKPSAVAIGPDHILDEWTPRHYQAKRLDVLRSLSDLTDVAGMELHQLVDFVGDARKPEQYRKGKAFIGVLHVIAEGVIDFAGIRSYAPKTPGIPVYAGEVLLSRINPRIPRAVVVPDLGMPILCSSEFEVMRAKEGIDPYMVAFLLLSQSAQAQIQSLTSGTSASHNRVRTKDLARVTIPVPRSGSDAAARLLLKVSEYRDVLTSMSHSCRAIAELRDNEGNWLTGL